MQWIIKNKTSLIVTLISFHKDQALFTDTLRIDIQFGYKESLDTVKK